ncbi:TcpQ domain-containing protein [Mycoavidus sp. SF9855]|uniref:TcpQ domain-containing protein n=1 Tax=Mycoavidus sp. SF9855 TaxID=2968475 RepID=UPI00211CDE22|nr:TcpQ domain-containing protein [Mycoavidus sp. SF9855]UUM22136.1 TcpQ domain-containing protein [Mycoavidus sp. SF9855]
MKHAPTRLLLMPALLSLLCGSSEILYASDLVQAPRSNLVQELRPPAAVPQITSPQTRTPTTYHFDWHISGAPEVAPIQVFDNDHKLYVQFRAGSPTPAILAEKPDGQVLLNWQAEPPYIVLNQFASRLHFRLGKQLAQAWRKPSKQQSATAWPAKIVKTVSPNALFLPAAPQKIPPTIQQAQKKSATTQWQVKRTDENLRQLLTRWAQIDDWHLIWDVDHDIPIQAEDQSQGNFKEAVRRVLGATALTEYQVKPCFYTNRVVRVVRQTTVCNPHQ